MAEKKNGTAPQKAQGRGMTKMEAVRRALGHLGNDAGRIDIQAYVKKEFNIEMSLDHISNYKGEILKKKKRRKGKRAARPEEPRKEAPKAPAASGSGGGATRAGISLRDLQTVRDLIERLGREQVRNLVELVR
jgi:hypothetical protein